MSKRQTTILFLFVFLCISWTGFAQNVTVQGYVFEDGNRGFLNLVKVQAFDKNNDFLVSESESDLDGVFMLDLPPQGEYKIVLEKRAFEKKEETIITTGQDPSKKMFVRYPMLRKPGYLFDVTIAKMRKKNDVEVDAIQGAHIEVYNNTTGKEILNLKNHPNPTFHVNFEQGNHYTILIRKENFFNKRMEAYVNVKDCILCFEGIGSVRPGVSDVLTEGNKMGTLLANVELEPLVLNKAIKFDKIYYDYNSARIKTASKLELDKLVNILKINPSLIIELSSHTDSRGKDSYNLKLSQRRAEAAARYIVNHGDIDRDRVRPKGYGETKLVNRCKNDVECTEKQHQRNRRTEFKIIAFRADRFSEMSLLDIIEEERRAKLLEEILNQEVVKVEAGEELPEEIKKQMEKEKETTTTEKKMEKPVAEKEEVSPDTKPKKENKTVLEKEGKKPENQIPTEAKKMSDAARPQTSEQKTDVNAEDIITPTEEIAPEPFQETSEDFDATSSSGGSLIVAEKEVAIGDALRLPQDLPGDYTGYKVEFYTAAYELPRSHEIFSRHGNITKELLKNGSYAYLLGDFTDWKAANSFLNKIMVSRYPDARIVRYKKGRRLK